MKRSDTSRDEGRFNEGGAEQVTTNLVALGDVIYIRLRGGSWWPAQIVDENTVNESVKPGKRSAGKVLVRLYGSYKYLYVDPIKCRSEFEMILKQNNGSYRKIFQQALAQDLPSLKSFRSKNSGAKTKAKETSKGNGTKANSSKVQEKEKCRIYKPDEDQNKVKQLKSSSRTQNMRNSPKQNEVLRDGDLSGQIPEITSSGKSQELSARRIKVMNKLGLIAPPGSPFHKY